MPITITTRVEDKIVREIDKVAAAEAVDRSAVIRKFLVKSLKDWLIQKALEDYENGKLTLWQAAKKCGISLWEIIDKAKEKTVHVPYGIDELKDDLAALR